MNDELYDLWIQRANVEAPVDFADRVMDAVRREPLPSSEGVLVQLLTFHTVRIAACVLASLAFLSRMVAVVAVFFPQ